MIGRKVNTYSKRKPTVLVRPSSVDITAKEENKLKEKGVDDLIPSVLNVIDEHVVIKKREREDLLSIISATLQSTNIIRSPAPKSRKSEIRPRLSVAPTEFEYEDLLQKCNQSDPIMFTEWWISEFKQVEKTEKIGESTFSEVFKISKKNGEVKVIKIMPMLPPGTRPNPFQEVEHSPEPIQLSHLLHEIEALMALELLRLERRYAIPTGYTGFNRFHQCHLLKGAYPDQLSDEWDNWLTDNESYNDSPRRYSNNDLHIVLVMDYGGVDLEHYHLTSVTQIRSIVLQVMTAIMLAEDKLQFEHRDLHPGNILITPTHRDTIQLGNYLHLPTAGLLCSIIDCSLSRFTTKKEVFYRDLRREGWLFEGTAEDSEQYEMYRRMRVVAGEDWQTFQPKTNRVWIAFLVRELVRRYSKYTKKEQQLYEFLSTIETKLEDEKLSLKEVFYELANYQ